MFDLRAKFEEKLLDAAETLRADKEIKKTELNKWTMLSQGRLQYKNEFEKTDFAALTIFRQWFEIVKRLQKSGATAPW